MVTVHAGDAYALLSHSSSFSTFSFIFLYSIRFLFKSSVSVSVPVLIASESGERKCPASIIRPWRGQFIVKFIGKVLKWKIKEKGGRLEWQKCIIWIINNAKNMFLYLNALMFLWCQLPEINIYINYRSSVVSSVTTEVKEIVHPKMNHLFTVMFQTCMTRFFLWKAKEDI